MSDYNVNLIISGPNNEHPATYKAFILRGNTSFADQVTEPNTKYVIKWDFNLNGETVTVPENCILEFDGGILHDGTIVGQDTFINDIGGLGLEKLFAEDIVREGTWRTNGGGSFVQVQSDWNQTNVSKPDYIKNKPNIPEGVIVDTELSKTSTNPVQNRVITEALENAGGNPDKPYDPTKHSGLGRKTLELKEGGSNVLTQQDFSDSNTVYIIQYDFTLGEDIDIPANCILEFDGGSFKNGSINNSPKIISEGYDCFDNISFPDGINNSELYAEWWKHDEDADSSTVLSQIMTCAFKSNGIKVLFGKKKWKFENTLELQSHSSNSYTGYEFIIEGVQNETPTLIYTGSDKAIVITDESSNQRGSFVHFKSIKMSAEDAEYIIYLNKASAIILDKCSFYCPNGICLFADNMWTYTFKDSFFEGERGIVINRGTSAYMSNLFFQCTVNAVHLGGAYVHISNIFGDFNNGTFLDLNYCRGFISSIGCESKNIDSIITARTSMISIGEMDIFKPLPDTATIFDGSMSYIHVDTMHITDTNANTPRGYLVKGSWHLNVTINKLQTVANSRFKYKPNTSDEADCAVLVKSYGEGEEFAEGTIKQKETEWFLPIYAGTIGENRFNDGYYDTPMFKNSRMIFGLSDNKTATKVINGEDTDFDIRYYDYLRKDDVFINSRASKGFPFFAWSAVAMGNDNLFNNASFKYVPFLIAVNGYSEAPDPSVARTGLSIFNKSDRIPVWWGGNYWVNYDGVSTGVVRYGRKNNRPDASLIYGGFQYFDTTLNKPIWWNGTYWVDAVGTRITWPITFTLTNVTASNQTQPSVNESYTTILSAATGYSLPTSITVKMDDTTLTAGTDYTYVQSTGTVVILGIGGSGGVTADIIITASGVANSQH